MSGDDSASAETGAGADDDEPITPTVAATRPTAPRIRLERVTSVVISVSFSRR
jgi:hypothetical protein